MPKLDYNRYAILYNTDGTIDRMPFVPIPVNPTDKYEDWVLGRSRLDKLSEKYYGNPFYDFLILYANPEFISEFDIDDGVVIRIPFPLSKARLDYETELNAIKNK
jgi:hypothetical protein